MKFRSNAIADIATIEEVSFNFRPEKSTVPVQTGWSS